MLADILRRVKPASTGTSGSVSFTPYGFTATGNGVGTVTGLYGYYTFTAPVTTSTMYIAAGGGGAGADQGSGNDSSVKTVVGNTNIATGSGNGYSIGGTGIAGGVAYFSTGSYGDTYNNGLGGAGTGGSGADGVGGVSDGVGGAGGAGGDIGNGNGADGVDGSAGGGGGSDDQSGNGMGGGMYKKTNYSITAGTQLVIIVGYLQSPAYMYGGSSGAGSVYIKW